LGPLPEPAPLLRHPDRSSLHPQSKKVRLSDPSPHLPQFQTPARGRPYTLLFLSIRISFLPPNSKLQPTLSRFSFAIEALRPPFLPYYIAPPDADDFSRSHLPQLPTAGTSLNPLFFSLFPSPLRSTHTDLSSLVAAPKFLPKGNTVPPLQTFSPFVCLRNHYRFHPPLPEKSTRTSSPFPTPPRPTIYPPRSPECRIPPPTSTSL